MLDNSSYNYNLCLMWVKLPGLITECRHMSAALDCLISIQVQLPSRTEVRPSRTDKRTASYYTWYYQ